MSRKRWAILSLSLLFSALGLIVAAVAAIDPFEIYRKATAFIPPISSGTQSYSNAGIAKSYDYDSVIIGTSMTENFTPSQLDTLLGGRFVKLCVNGGTPHDLALMLDMAFRTHDVRTVFYGLDIDAMNCGPDASKADMPEYLYDDSLLNDARYWFNKSVLARYIPRCLRTWGRTDETLRDTMYAWGDLYAYGEDAVLSRHPLSAGIVAQTPREENPAPVSLYQKNLDANILPYIKAHPDTQFVFFFPPYSLVRWHAFYAGGTLNFFLNQKEAVVSALLPYDNVRIYDFQAETQWITDLDHYIDAQHYGPWINDAIAKAVSRDENRVRSVQDARENDEEIIALIDHLNAAGSWSAAFPDQ